jgi:hypothetical protein
MLRGRQGPSFQARGLGRALGLVPAQKNPRQCGVLHVVISAKKAAAKARQGGCHKGNLSLATFWLSAQNAPTAWWLSEPGASLLLYVGMNTIKQFEQAAFHPEFQMPAILSARPITNLRHRGCRSSAILLKHVDQGLRLEQPPFGVGRHGNTFALGGCIPWCVDPPKSSLSANFRLNAANRMPLPANALSFIRAWCTRRGAAESLPSMSPKPTPAVGTSLAS